MTPHDEMKKYDSEGRAYIISYIAFVSGDSQRGSFVVHELSEKWMKLENDTGVFWVNMDHIAVVQIVLL